jgi:RNA polymerase-binding transcription factor DksA/very-short-patch-repair endonuclease
MTRGARDEYRLVSKEYGKKKMHIPLRRLLPRIPTILPAVKPCLLMSPLSVANYLPRDQFTFDLVIFDEASQVLPADAIGAILRGRQLVVLGDSKQLPPTRFFQRHLDDGDFESDDEIADAVAFDSILEISAAALPETSLRWHYRSRDERLIAFSNRKFYSERPLITFPSPDPEGDTGVRFVYVAGGLYDRGGSKTNVVEARQVVDLVVEHLERYGWERSLGVVALSISQRDAIELELRRRLLDRPDLEPFLAETGSEPLFIKNLETVQGDERDEVILSIGYGPSEPGGTPALAFGPVNVSGGERRLNVAITRAKYAVTLVSSMRPEQLDRVAQLASTGPKVMAEYMSYAARGGRFETEGETDPTRAPQSPFEEAVLEALRSRGYVVDPQVGASGFRIDLGVRHPDIETRYILGLECDGATYHSAASARDRDRLRQEMLELQGWRIHRIWSTDWIQHPDVTIQAVVDRIEQLRTLEEVGVLARPRMRTVPPTAEDSEPVPSADKQTAPASSLPRPFVAEQEEALIFERSRLEQQVATIHDSYLESAAQPDKGFTSGQVEHALEQRLAHVRDALSRIQAGSYGACQNCGRVIELERLEAVPSTPLCRDCSQASR